MDDKFDFDPKYHADTLTLFFKNMWKIFSTYALLASLYGFIGLCSILMIGFMFVNIIDYTADILINYAGMKESTSILWAIMTAMIFLIGVLMLCGVAANKTAAILHERRHEYKRKR